MQIYTILEFIFFIAVLTFLFLFIRRKLRTYLKRTGYTISKNLSNYYICHKPQKGESNTNIEDLEHLVDILFNNTFISNEKYEETELYFKAIYERLCRIQKISNLFFIENETISNAIYQYENLYTYVKEHNKDLQKQLLDQNKTFFDNVLAYPLDKQQREAILSEEDNCLVVSSAGSGKTSSIVGKVEYLTKVKHVDAKKILLISYTNKAAAELTERMGIEGLKGCTFHKLAIDIIAKERKEKPSICDNTDAVFVNIFHELLCNKKFKKAIIEYFIDYTKYDTEEEKAESDKRALLSAAKSNKIKAEYPDMDGKPVYVRSEQEKKICFVLTTLGVKFRYEEPYEIELKDEHHCQYRPDFSIHYNENGSQKRVYLEHFGIDEHGMVPVWFAEDKGISYKEANELYGDGITWKRETHKKYGTTLIETTSADFKYFDIVKKLKKLLDKAGVPYAEMSEEQLYDLIMPQNSNAEKAFIRQTVTFITLMKTNSKDFTQIRRLAKSNKDKRSLFFIDKIIKPIYDKYTEYMNEHCLKDFNDLIIEATEICNSWNQTPYEYIIVDEFQDISMDRYNFLSALRKGEPKAKLFCVGDDWQSIYRFSGSDISLFTDFSKYFGYTDIRKIETTYRFGEPLVSISSKFIQKNPIQIKKSIHPFRTSSKTDMAFYEYDNSNYISTIKNIIASIPAGKSIFLLGRYSFDDYYLSSNFKEIKRGNKYYYVINEREIEFITIHKSKGLEADYVILLQCNKGTFGFPSLIHDDNSIKLILGEGDKYPYAEERRLMYVAMTRAKIKTFIMYNKQSPSIFVTEFLHPERLKPIYNPNKKTTTEYSQHRNANKRWTKRADAKLLKLYNEGNSIKQLSQIMGRSQTAIVMRLQELGIKL